MGYCITGDWEWYDPYVVPRTMVFSRSHLTSLKAIGKGIYVRCFKDGISFRFKRGRLGLSVFLPGNGKTLDSWPRFWALGNLGQPGYAATTDGVWPWSYEDGCAAGIAPYYAYDGEVSMLKGTRLPACTCSSEEHLNPNKSSSALEIDINDQKIAPRCM